MWQLIKYAIQCAFLYAFGQKLLIKYFINIIRHVIGQNIHGKV
jgi:hypothetical protein